MPGTRVPPEPLVWAVAALAEGLGMRAVARVVAGDPNTVRQWRVEAADHATALSRHLLREVPVTPVQLEELLAVVSAAKAGQVHAAEPLVRRSRSPHGGWVVLAPESNLLRAVAVGARPLAMVQPLGPHVVQVLAPGCVPLFRTAGLKDYVRALLPHFGSWVHPPRRQATGLTPNPRGRPVPELL